MQIYNPKDFAEFGWSYVVNCAELVVNRTGMRLQKAQRPSLAPTAQAAAGRVPPLPSPPPSPPTIKPARARKSPLRRGRALSRTATPSPATCSMTSTPTSSSSPCRTGTATLSTSSSTTTSRWMKKATSMKPTSSTLWTPPARSAPPT